ncbi:hypothetical protein EZL74_05280 [Flavobacterium silvisoli]|uniref:DUF4293 family protein n=1 Tax=Flavobacterium silvisoli TaxID=2529433 RepID=A0A4Q9Z6G1_9FLAO|nr:hypothetical protein [Flavobacterium silvisoli]TBX70159.1 hypothetical protein EZL74_05280 [Flavobacterium silvisoli]
MTNKPTIIKKILIFLLLMSFQFGYLSWGNNSSSFVFQTEAKLFRELMTDPLSLIHPFIMIPLLGQFLLLFALFQKEPGKTITFTGIACSGLLMLMLLFIGIWTLEFKILSSAVPFVVLSLLLFRSYKK